MTISLPTLNRESNPLLTVMRAAGRAGVAVLLWGKPGVGKSSLLAALAEAEGLPMETVLASLREPADFAGLPVVQDTGVELAAPAWATRLAMADEGYLFLDELTTAGENQVVALEDGTLFFEAKAGPYVPLAPNEKAAFAPPEGDPRVPEYLARLKALCSAR